jgi:hypothetical protein
VRPVPNILLLGLWCLRDAAGIPADGVR